MQEGASRENQPEDEVQEKPEILYRAFTVDPQTMTVESLRTTLTPGKVNEEDKTKINDGNELGVYMSTNRRMTETAYAHTSLGLHIKVPKYNNRGLMVDFIKLPQCGVVVEVSTENLPIRKPRISEALGGVYNNGFEGDEWIADEVPVVNYRIIRLILSAETYDKEQIIVDIQDDTDEELERGIEVIKAGFEKRKEKALECKAFLEQTDPKIRENEYVIKRSLEKYREGK